MTVPVARHLSFLGIAKEATLGTGVAATNYIRYTPGSLQVHNHVNYLEDKGQRGAMVDLYGVTAGTVWGETQWGAPVFADDFGWPLAGVLGDLTTTGGGAPYSTTFAVKQSQPKSYALSDYDAVDTQRYPGQMFSEVVLKFSVDGMLEYTAKTMGWQPTTPSNPTFSNTSTLIVPTWAGTVTIGGGGNTNLMSGEVTIKRPVTVQHTINNTQNPNFTFAGPVSVSGKLQFSMNDNTEMTRYLTNTQPALVLDWTTGASAALIEIKAQMTKCAYKDAQINRGTKDFNVVDVTFDAIANTTDVGATGGYSPCLFTLQNAIASGTYV